jgi:hypothetical protein
MMTSVAKHLVASLQHRWLRAASTLIDDAAAAGVGLRRNLLVLAFGSLAFCAFSKGAACQSNEVARITVHVTSQPSQIAGEVIPEAKTTNGKPLVTLGREENGRTVAITPGTYILVRFDAASGATGFEFGPPGVLEAPVLGILHLPSGAIGMLRAMKPGTATISVKSIRPRASTGSGNPSGIGSSNWSGYVITGGPFSKIIGQWGVPTVTGDAGSASASWIGIDGYPHTNNNIIQVGTLQAWDPVFGPSYYAWWQIGLAGSVRLPNPVGAYDLMYAEISLVDPATSTWSITISSSQGWTFTTQQMYSGPASSVEWIEEDPIGCNNSGCSYESFADYHEVRFEADRGLIASESMNMVQGGVTISSPSDPGATQNGCDNFFLVDFGGVSPPPYDCNPDYCTKCMRGQICCECNTLCMTPPACQRYCGQGQTKSRRLQ